MDGWIDNQRKLAGFNSASRTTPVVSCFSSPLCFLEVCIYNIIIIYNTVYNNIYIYIIHHKLNCLPSYFYHLTYDLMSEISFSRLRHSACAQRRTAPHSTSGSTFKDRSSRFSCSWVLGHDPSFWGSNFDPIPYLYRCIINKFSKV